ncbi:MAG TPA: PD-(D/E)XK nuclease family protein [Conexivisphaerales archaeon]|nr:PD-(D/E)XK nuclease family protein [Conexivisphaerales archaeon]
MSGAADGEEERLVKALRDGLVSLWREESDQHVRAEGHYYPSSIGSCLRKQYYLYTVEEKPDPEKLAVFATGKGVHAAVAEALRKSGLVKVDAEEYPVELKVSEEVRLKGRVDVLIVELDGSKVVVEVKSTSRIPDVPHETHFFQLQTYLHSMSVQKGFLLYWDKRTGETRAFRVERDPEALQKIAERAIILHEHLKSGKPPFKEAVMEGRYWECDFCEYRAICSPFLIEGLAKGSTIAVYGLDGVVIDDRRRLAAALAQEELPAGLDVTNLRGQAKEAFDSAYFDPSRFSLDGPSEAGVSMAAADRKGGASVVLLADRPWSTRAATEAELKRLRVPFDALLVMPSDYGKPHFWKSDTLRRLHDVYTVRRFVDVPSYALSEASKLGIPSESPAGRPA